MRHRVAASLCVLFVTAVAARQAHALANRVFVSARSGNNANSCDNIGTPCQTFAGAVAQLNPDGEVIVLDSGGYGPVAITQGVTIEAPAGVTAFIHPPAGDAITINAAGANVTLRGLVVNAGAGNGIAVTAVGVLNVERCTISGFAIGINVTTSARIAVFDSSIKNNTSYGINAMNGAEVDVVGSRFQDNALGFNVNAAGGDVRVTLRETAFTGNGTGLEVLAVTTRTASVDISHCTFSHNGIGILAGTNSGSAPVRAAYSTVTANTIGVEASLGGTFFSQGNNLIRDNSSENIVLLTGGSSSTITGD